MKGFILAIIIGASVIGGFKGIYWVFYPDYTYRYKMTVEVNTPDGIKSGSSVIEVHTQQMPEWLAGLSGGHYRWSRVKGEAPIVHLDDKKRVLVLIRPKKNWDYAKTLLLSTIEYKRNFRGIPIFTPEAKKLDKDKYSEFVTLTDSQNPNTMMTGDQRIVPYTFGEYTNVNNITIQVTEEPVQFKIKHQMSWLLENNEYLDIRSLFSDKVGKTKLEQIRFLTHIN